MEHFKAEFGQHCVDGYEVDALGFARGDEVHFLDPGGNELVELDTLCLMKNCQYLCKEPFVINNDDPINICNERGRKAMLESSGTTFLTLILYQIASTEHYELLLTF